MSTLAALKGTTPVDVEAGYIQWQKTLAGLKWDRDCAKLAGEAELAASLADDIETAEKQVSHYYKLGKVRDTEAAYLKAIEGYCNESDAIANCIATLDYRALMSILSYYGESALVERCKEAKRIRSESPGYPSDDKTLARDLKSWATNHDLMSFANGFTEAA